MPSKPDSKFSMTEPDMSMNVVRLPKVAAAFGKVRITPDRSMTNRRPDPSGASITPIRDGNCPDKAGKADCTCMEPAVLGGTSSMSRVVFDDRVLIPNCPYEMEGNNNAPIQNKNVTTFMLAPES